ncbi:PREDICTED: putative phosphatidylglycerol/phosphatidylinositol transfer protein DDB_G0278295 isoform X2 [Amphimedon queenslandica]|uniref:MD-2-related lipid-recognition domain-containing protein n=1 Tax=Amphimedon queenslandica TaxID=400682 RepID=A0A1X7UNF5_AMPQE|nr:PREDICTED: putative phosphatidylglycerol/phosphatidylinositol transfer protein DDB_G0278295 isoform X2 [Amphimedon queenslandica]|eukprot:XP_003387343.1 PREDICTED: putative phosphatidylglycerol/phosphatidylinositol transfer protein DDB_G0278295 isoform X2 [Amphimedon queenslandica]
MKTALLLFGLLVAVLHASPIIRKPLIDLKPALTLPSLQDSPLGDIWTDCSKSSDPAKLINLTITPDPPQKGKEIKVDAFFTLKENVTSGSIKLTLKYFFVPVSETYDICKDAIGGCPLSDGTHEIVIQDSIPGSAPSGHYKGSAVLTDQSGRELGCINLDFKLS